MAQEITRIDLGGFNCYLIHTGGGFALVDTGLAARRGALEKALQAAGCTPGSLRLVLITHADVDHVGNCAYLQERYRAPIAAHREEAGFLQGDASAPNRKPRPDRMPFLFRLVMGLSGRRATFTCRPDVLLEDGQDLAPYGLAARALHLPGHTRGSLGILTADGALYCGDLFANWRRPALHGIIDDLPAARASLDRLRRLDVRTVYPGHGKPFALEQVRAE